MISQFSLFQTVEDDLQSDLSVDEAYNHLTFLVEEVGESLAGTKSIEKAALLVKTVQSFHVKRGGGIIQRNFWCCATDFLYLYKFN